MESGDLDFSTRIIHSEGHDKPLHAHVTPIFQTSSFVFDTPEEGRALFAGEKSGFIYSRLGNPTVQAFENLMAVAEEGKSGVAFGSGMGAVSASLFPFLKAGDSIIVGDTLYGMLS